MIYHSNKSPALAACAMTVAILIGGVVFTGRAAAQRAASRPAVPPGRANRASAAPQGDIFLRPVSGPLLFEDAVANDLGFTARQRRMPDSNTIWASLTPAQRKRLAQIVMHLEGNQLLFDPEIQSLLSLSKEQKEKLRAEQADSLRMMHALADPKTGVISEEDRPKMAAIRGESDAVIASIPTREQSAKIRALLGKPFDRTTIHGVGFGHSPGGKLGDPGPNVVRPEPPKVTKTSRAPDFVARTIDGKRVRLSDYKGKVVVLDFWATWCGPCKESMPGMQKLRSQIKDPNVVFLWLCVMDDQAKFMSFVKANPQYTFNFVFDPAGGDSSDRAKGIPASYSVAGIPTTFVIDRSGTVVFRGEGTDGRGPDIRLVAALKSLGVKPK